MTSLRLAAVSALLGLVGTGCSHGTFEEDRVYEHAPEWLFLEASGDATWTTSDNERGGSYYLHGQTGDVVTEWPQADDVTFEVRSDDELMELQVGEDGILVATGRSWIRTR